MAEISTNIDEKDLKNDLLRVFEETKCTKQDNYIKYGKYSRSVIKRVFGSWNKMLRNPETNRPLFIDAYFSKEKIAIEVDGGQHYAFTKIFHQTMEDFHRIQQRDRIKDKILKEHGITVIRIRHANVKEIKNLLDKVSMQ